MTKDRTLNLINFMRIGDEVQMKNLNQLKDIVERILIDDEKARKDDNYLILKVIEKLHPDEVGKSFNEVMLNAKHNKINFESIRRCRQKVQQLYPELKDFDTATKRQKAIESYLDFAFGR